MTPNEEAAYHAGVEAMRQMAMVAALTIEARDDAREIRQQAAAAALHGLAEGAKALLPHKPDPLVLTMRAIAADPGTSGTVPCPRCARSFRWTKNASNGHVHGQCETPGCVRVMQ